MSKLNWKKVIGWGVAALVVIGVVGTNIYQKREQKGDRPIVKIGALYPMSGAAAVYGEAAQKADKHRIVCIPGLQQPVREPGPSAKAGKHRRYGICRLQQPDRRKHSGRGAEHRRRGFL